MLNYCCAQEMSMPTKLGPLLLASPSPIFVLDCPRDFTRQMQRLLMDIVNPLVTLTQEDPVCLPSRLETTLTILPYSVLDRQFLISFIFIFLFLFLFLL